jgi:hypothetical protein
MSIGRPASRVFGFAALLAATTACSSSGWIEGKWYNSRSGELAMELQGGKVVYAQGQEGRDMTYEVKGDSLVIHDPRSGLGDGLTFGIEKDGTLSLGLLGSLTKNRP